jgi:hypothetical protein
LKVALHFDADANGDYYGPPTEERVLRALATLPSERRHVRLFCGDLLFLQHATTRAQIISIAKRILDAHGWRTLDEETFVDASHRTNIFVILVEGLPCGSASTIDRTLQADPTFFGSLEVTPATPVHWVMYDQSLIPVFRIVGDELRMFYEKESYEAGGDRDNGMFEHWKELRIYPSIDWEDRGLRGTIFDEYDTFEHAKRLADLEESLSGQLEAVTNELLIRCGDLDPVLPETLHAAVHGYDFYESGEQLAQVAVSCRRFLERLANALYPPRDELVNGRRVGSAEYRNRLWAYTEEKLSGTSRKVVLATLEDIGRRVDRIDELANKGVHAAEVTRTEVQRLIVGLVTLAYDILTLEPPSKVARLEPYENALRNFLSHTLSDDE